MKFFQCCDGGDVFATEDRSRTWKPCDRCRTITREEYVAAVHEEHRRSTQEADAWLKIRLERID